jgi:hypothetical protein
MNKATARKKATANGHVLGRFTARRASSRPEYGTRGQKLYDVAHCERCGDAVFANDPDAGPDEVNPAVQEKCRGK